MLKYKIKYIKKNNDDLSSIFQKILYFTNHSNVIVEDLTSNESYLISEYELSKHILIPNIKTPWSRTIAGELIRYKNNNLEQIVNLMRKPKFIELKIIINKVVLKDKFKFKHKNFKCICKKSNITSIKNLHQIRIITKLPIFQILGKISSTNYDNFSLEKLFMCIGSEIYRYPYGNVDQNNSVCLGHLQNSFQNTKQMFFEVVINRANDDYGFHLKNIEEPTNIDFLSKYFYKESLKFFNYLKGLFYLSTCSIENIKKEPDKYFLKPVKEKWMAYVRPNEIK